jgi:hypothetical protein
MQEDHDAPPLQRRPKNAQVAFGAVASAGQVETETGGQVWGARVTCQSRLPGIELDPFPPALEEQAQKVRQAARGACSCWAAAGTLGTWAHSVGCGVLRGPGVWLGAHRGLCTALSHPGSTFCVAAR